MRGHICPRNNTIQTVIQTISSGNWTQAVEQSKTLLPFSRLRHELTVVPQCTKHVLLRGNRLVIPSALQEKIITLAHEGHQGIVRTKQLLREKVWFPNIDKMTEQMYMSCIPCLAAVPTKTSEPLQMTDLPNLNFTFIYIVKYIFTNP